MTLTTNEILLRSYSSQVGCAMLAWSMTRCLHLWTYALNKDDRPVVATFDWVRDNQLRDRSPVLALLCEQFPLCSYWVQVQNLSKVKMLTRNTDLSTSHMMRWREEGEKMKAPGIHIFHGQLTWITSPSRDQLLSSTRLNLADTQLERRTKWVIRSSSYANWMTGFT